jgi:hypothetical protein
VEANVEATVDTTDFEDIFEFDGSGDMATDSLQGTFAWAADWWNHLTSMDHVLDGSEVGDGERRWWSVSKHEGGGGGGGGMAPPHSDHHNMIDHDRGHGNGHGNGPLAGGWRGNSDRHGQGKHEEASWWGNVSPAFAFCSARVLF